MISTPQEIEQNAMAIANWIIYNGKPFILPADNKQNVYLAVLTEEQMQRLQAPIVQDTQPVQTESEEVTE